MKRKEFEDERFWQSRSMLAFHRGHASALLAHALRRQRGELRRALDDRQLGLALAPLVLALDHRGDAALRAHLEVRARRVDDLAELGLHRPEGDVDEALEDYVEACVRYVEKDAGAMINFAEAGLLLQGSAVVYGRKVDGVHALVYRVLELLRTGQKEKEKAEKKQAEGTQEEEESDEEEPLDPLPENALQPLKPCRAGKNIDLDEDKEKELEQSDADPLVAMLFRDTDEDAPFFGASFCEDGSLRLPGLEGDGAIVDEDREREPLIEPTPR